MDAWIEGWADEPIPAWADDQAERDAWDERRDETASMLQALDLFWDLERRGEEIQAEMRRLGEEAVERRPTGLSAWLEKLNRPPDAGSVRYQALLGEETDLRWEHMDHYDAFERLGLHGDPNAPQPWYGPRGKDKKKSRTVKRS